MSFYRSSHLENRRRPRRPNLPPPSLAILYHTSPHTHLILRLRRNDADLEEERRASELGEKLKSVPTIFDNHDAQNSLQLFIRGPCGVVTVMWYVVLKILHCPSG